MALCALLSAGCVSRLEEARAANIKPEKDRKLAPDFSLKDSNGKAMRLSDYKGKVVLLNFWATFCMPCKVEIPWFIEFEKEFKDQGFAVLGVAMDDEGWEVVKPYIERRQVNYRILLGTDSVAQMYGGVDALPTTFIVDREGRIAAVHVGLVGKSDYRNDLVQVLEKSERAAR